MKKSFKAALAAALVAVLALGAGCSKSPYKDGSYAAQMPEFASSGWKDIMELTIEDGKIVDVNWDAIYVDDSIPIRKKQYSKSGLYGMLAAGAGDEWYDQAIAVERYLLEHGVDALEIGEGGYTDAITGCTIHIDAFEYLVRACLIQAEK